MELATQFGENIELIATVVIGILIAIFKYKKTEDIPKESISVNNIKVFADLITAIKDQTEESVREHKKQSRLTIDLKEALEDNTDKVIEQTDSLINLLKFIKRRNNEFN